VDSGGDRPLHLVCNAAAEVNLCGVTAIVRALLKAGADANARNRKTQRTPLHNLIARLVQTYTTAAPASRIVPVERVRSIFTLLLRAGAESSARDSQGVMASVLIQGVPDLRNLLEECSAKGV